MSIVLKVSKPNKNADSSQEEDIIFDSQKTTHPVFSINDYLITSNQQVQLHGSGYPAKVWVNIVNAFNTSNDGRLPIEDSSIPQYDYKVNNQQLIFDRGAATNKTLRVIVFAKSITTV